jgi:hypothetical protein
VSAVLQYLVSQLYKNGSVKDIEGDVATKQKPKLKLELELELESMDEVDPKLLRTFEKLGVALRSTLFSTA